MPFFAWILGSVVSPIPDGNDRRGARRQDPVQCFLGILGIEEFLQQHLKYPVIRPTQSFSLGIVHSQIARPGKTESALQEVCRLKIIDHRAKNRVIPRV
jgi:hypothetical protein